MPVHRQEIRSLMAEEPWIHSFRYGIEQEYTLLHQESQWPLELPVGGLPGPQGDWNGAGAQTNYSTESMRNDGGIDAIKKAFEKLGLRHKEHKINRLP